MSLEFNRRSFLKYSAAAAVAVAGSSLLTGCGEDEYQKTGKIGSTLKLMGTFKMDNPVFSNGVSGTDGVVTGDFVCDMSFKCTSEAALNIDPGYFAVTVTHGSNDPVIYRHASKQNNHATLTIDDSNPNLTKNKSFETKLHVTNMSVLDDDKVEVRYFPRLDSSNGQMSVSRSCCTWKMTAKVNGTTVTFE